MFYNKNRVKTGKVELLSKNEQLLLKGGDPLEGNPPDWDFNGNPGNPPDWDFNSNSSFGNPPDWDFNGDGNPGNPPDWD
jgi:hypothetical protein